MADRAAVVPGWPWIVDAGRRSRDANAAGRFDARGCHHIPQVARRENRFGQRAGSRPLDERRFNASAAAMSFAVAGRLLFALAAAALALLGVVLRRRVLPRMDSLQAQIQACVTSAIPAFQGIHPGRAGEPLLLHEPALAS